MGKHFGTDGVRGVAGTELTPQLAFRLGQAGAEVLGREHKRPVFVVGRDTRISGDMLEAALTAGILSAGGDVISAGIIPTPAVAYLARHYKASAGAVISASHNPFEYNGIKFSYLRKIYFARTFWEGHRRSRTDRTGKTARHDPASRCTPTAPPPALTGKGTGHHGTGNFVHPASPPPSRACLVKNVK